jgi:hypothetical protein
MRHDLKNAANHLYPCILFIVMLTGFRWLGDKHDQQQIMHDRLYHLFIKTADEIKQLHRNQ